jgi:hypothetical protein
MGLRDDLYRELVGVQDEFATNYFDFIIRAKFQILSSKNFDFITNFFDRNTRNDKHHSKTQILSSNLDNHRKYLIY